SDGELVGRARAGLFGGPMRCGDVTAGADRQADAGRDDAEQHANGEQPGQAAGEEAPELDPDEPDHPDRPTPAVPSGGPSPSARRRSNARTSRIPAGSSPLDGSSSNSSRGCLSIAAAMARRWRMPRE